MRKVLIVVLLLIASNSFADIYTCKDSTGRVVFQDKPCSKTEQTVTHRKVDGATTNGPTLPIFGVYNSCREMEAEVYETEEGLEALKYLMEDYNLTYNDVVRTLESCNFDIIPEIYLRR